MSSLQRVIDGRPMGDLLSGALIPDESTINSEEECAICYDKLNSQPHSSDPLDSVVELAGCTHLFHYKCIFRWANINRTCPNCRVMSPVDYDFWFYSIFRDYVLHNKRWVVNSFGEKGFSLLTKVIIVLDRVCKSNTQELAPIAKDLGQELLLFNGVQVEPNIISDAPLSESDLEIIVRVRKLSPKFAQFIKHLMQYLNQFDLNPLASQPLRNSLPIIKSLLDLIEVINKPLSDNYNQKVRDLFYSDFKEAALFLSRFTNIDVEQLLVYFNGYGNNPLNENMELLNLPLDRNKEKLQRAAKVILEDARFTQFRDELNSNFLLFQQNRIMSQNFLGKIVAINRLKQRDFERISIATFVQGGPQTLANEILKINRIFRAIFLIQIVIVVTGTFMVVYKLVRNNTLIYQIFRTAILSSTLFGRMMLFLEFITS
ncbi:MAG: RING finger domain-containing protein [Rhabdochlamydiaceae bacterium]|nr:RING finger domain-containing protein [Candidatus Amphrikana amoebophyrae]